MNINTIGNFITKSNTAQKILKMTEKNPQLFETGFVLALSTILRPATIAVTPVDKENKKFFMLRSIASGFVETFISMICIIPLNKWANNVKKRMLNNKGFYNEQKASAFKTLVNRGSKFLIAPIQVGLLFYIIPKIESRIKPKNKIDVKG